MQLDTRNIPEFIRSYIDNGFLVRKPLQYKSLYPERHHAVDLISDIRISVGGSEWYILQKGTHYIPYVLFMFHEIRVHPDDIIKVFVYEIDNYMSIFQPLPENMPDNVQKQIQFCTERINHGFSSDYTKYAFVEITSIVRLKELQESQDNHCDAFFTANGMGDMFDSERANEIRKEMKLISSMPSIAIKSVTFGKNHLTMCI